MSSIYKVIEIIGGSEKSWEDDALQSRCNFDLHPIQRGHSLQIPPSLETAYKKGPRGVVCIT